MTLCNWCVLLVWFLFALLILIVSTNLLNPGNAAEFVCSRARFELSSFKMLLWSPSMKARSVSNSLRPLTSLGKAGHSHRESHRTTGFLLFVADKLLSVLIIVCTWVKSTSNLDRQTQFTYHCFDLSSYLFLSITCSRNYFYGDEAFNMH